MAVRNVARGGGKNFKVEVTGLKELERKLKALGKGNPALSQNMWRIVGKMADGLRDEMMSAARAAGWASVRLKYKGRHKSGVVTGEDAIRSIFSYAKPRSQVRQRYSALAGVGKKRSMFEWIAGRHPKSSKAKVAPGNPVAMSLATALEFGTTVMQPRPAIRATILAAKSRIISSLSEQYKSLLQQLAR